MEKKHTVVAMFPIRAMLHSGCLTSSRVVLPIMDWPSVAADKSWRKNYGDIDRMDTTVRNMVVGML